MKSFEDRIDEIIRTSYSLLCNKIAGGAITVDNEASLQLQLGVIMKTIGHMYEFKEEDHFSIVLEKVVDGIHTWKSKGKARIDILVSLTNGSETYSAALELKYFPKAEGETITDNRFMMLGDIENLEGYKHERKAGAGYFVLYTTNKNYMVDSRSKVRIGNHEPISGKIESNNRTVNLTGSYLLKWDSFENDNYFLLLKV